MSALFQQNIFSGGLDTKLDATKDPSRTGVSSVSFQYNKTTYPLLINGRSRRGVISPTAEHVRLDNVPLGNYQGLYISGKFLLIFVSGLAYFADVTQTPIIFYPVIDWQPFDSAVKRIYAEQAPATSNLFSRAGTPDSVIKTFNKSISIYPAAFYCFDGLTPPQAVRPDGTAIDLGSYASWTPDSPLYVPIGVLPAFAANKLFIASADRSQVYSSVSGRPSDFVINLDSTGNKGGDETTVSQAVSLNPITAIRSISTGEVLVGTLYGTYVLQMDYTNTQFGEPYELPVLLFPAGPVNEISIIDVLSDTAMITQSGIHAFNPTAQAKRESNNFPLGAPIHGLLVNPNTEKALTQVDTCTGLYDDYALFAMNTIYGYGAIVYDTINTNYQALDLSFGRVKQFAGTKIDGVDRLFFITADNKLFEGFAGPKKNTTRLLLGEWTPSEAGGNVMAYIVNAVFGNVKEAGQVKISIFADKQFRESVVLDVGTDLPVANLPIPIPFTSAPQVVQAGFHFDQTRCWRLAAMIEWNFAGELTDFSVNGKIESGDNVNLDLAIENEGETLAFFADSGYSDELNSGGNFDASGIALVSVIKGYRYAFLANGSSILVNGNREITAGIFTAAGDTVAISGVTGQPKTFTLRTAENYMQVLDAINAEPDVTELLHGGDFAYPSGAQLDVELALLPINRPISYVCGNHDVATNNGQYFFNLLDTRRYYSKSYKHIDVFFFNGETFEPDGVDSLSRQAGILKNWLEASTAAFKIIVVHQPPFTNDTAHSPGRADLAYLLALPGVSAVIAGHAHNMERFDINGVPLFNCGGGGASLRGFIPNPIPDAFHASAYGYLLIESDAITCKLSFKDVKGNILDTFSLYT